MSQPPHEPTGGPADGPAAGASGSEPSYPAAPPPPPTEGGWGDPSALAPGGYYPGQPAGATGLPGAPGGSTPVPYAQWLARVGATLVDMAMLLPAYLVALVGTVMAGDGPEATGDASVVGVLLIVAGYVALVGVAVWNVIVRQGRTGWSIGKQALGIRLIGERTGEPIGAGLTFVRSLAHVLDQLPCYLGYLWPLWDPKRQTFADKIMGTVVVQQRKVI